MTKPFPCNYCGRITELSRKDKNTCSNQCAVKYLYAKKHNLETPFETFLRLTNDGAPDTDFVSSDLKGLVKKETGAKGNVGEFKVGDSVSVPKAASKNKTGVIKKIIDDTYTIDFGNGEVYEYKEYLLDRLTKEVSDSVKSKLDKLIGKNLWRSGALPDSVEVLELNYTSEDNIRVKMSAPRMGVGASMEESFTSAELNDLLKGKKVGDYQEVKASEAEKQIKDMSDPTRKEALKIMKDAENKLKK